MHLPERSARGIAFWCSVGCNDIPVHLVDIMKISPCETDPLKPVLI